MFRKTWKLVQCEGSQTKLQKPCERMRCIPCDRALGAKTFPGTASNHVHRLVLDLGNVSVAVGHGMKPNNNSITRMRRHRQEREVIYYWNGKTWQNSGKTASHLPAHLSVDPHVVEIEQEVASREGNQQVRRHRLKLDHVVCQRLKWVEKNHQIPTSAYQRVRPRH